MSDVKLLDISGTKRRKIWNLKLMNSKPTVRTKISDIVQGYRDFKRGW